jgi:hypothetical protein
MPNNIDTLFKVLESDPAYRGVYKSSSDLQQILSSPEKSKQFYNVLNSDPAYNGVYESFDKFKSVYTPAPPVEEKNNWDKFNTWAFKWANMINVAIGAYQYFAGPSEETKKKAYEEASEVKLPEYATDQERSEDLQQTFRNTFDLLNQGRSDEEKKESRTQAIKSLGFETSIKEDAEGNQFINYDKSLGFVVDEESKPILERQKSEIETAYDKQISGVKKVFDDLLDSQDYKDRSSSVGGYFKGLLQVLPLGLGEYGKTQEFKRLENQKASNLKKLETEKAKAMAYYSDALGEFKTIVDETTDAETKYTPFNPLASVDFNDSKSITNTFNQATKDLEVMSSTINVGKDFIRSQELVNYADKGLNLQYFNNPTLATIKKDIYSSGVFNSESDLALEQQQAIFTGIQHDRNAVFQLLDSYKKQKAEIDASIAETNEALKKGSVLTPDGKQQFATKNLLANKLGTYIQSQEKYYKYITDLQKDYTKSYQDYIGEDKKMALLGEFYPLPTALLEAGRTIAKYPVNINQAILNFVEDDGFSYELRHSLSKSDIQPEFLKNSVLGDIVTVDDKGETHFNLFNVDGGAFLYNTAKVSADSFILGLGMIGSAALFSRSAAAIAGAEARILGVGAEELTAKAGLSALGESTFKVGVGDVLGTVLKPGGRLLTKGILGEYGVAAGLNWAGETMVGSVVPSILLFSDEILKQELEKGLTYEQAKFTSTLLAAIEGATERLHPSEMSFVKQLIGKGEIKTLAELAENKIYKAAITDTIKQQTGKTISDKFYRSLFKASLFVKGFASTVKNEGDEEVIGLFAQQLVNYQGRLYNPKYTGEDFTMANILNTYLATAATMLPMGFTAGRAGVVEYNQTQKQAQFMVGAKSAPYYKATLDLYKDGKIGKEEFERRSNHIKNIEEIYSQSFLGAIQHPDYFKYNRSQQDLFTYQVFSKIVEADALKQKLLEDLTDEDRDEIVKDYDRSNLEIQTILEQGLFKSDEERVERTTESLDYYFEPLKVKALDDLRFVKSMIDKLVSYGEVEQNQGLKKSYLAKAGLLQERAAQIEKENYEQNKTTEDIAKENNANKAVTIPRPGIEGMNLKYNTPYYVSVIEEEGRGGLKKFTEPAMVINFQNPDGSINVTSQGNTYDLTLEELSKYEFTPKAEMDKLIKDGDPRGFIFQAKNMVFTYEFNKATKGRDKVVRGRVKYDPQTKTARLVYKNKAGEIETYVLDKKVLTDYREGKGRLKYVKTVETEAEYQNRLQKSMEQAAKTNFEKLQGLSVKRLEFLFKYIDQKKAELLSTKDTIRKVEDELLDIEIQLEKLTKEVTKNSVSTALSDLFDKISSLQNRKEEVESILEEQYEFQNDLQKELDYIADRYSNEDFGTDTPFMDILVEDLLKMEDQLTAVDGYISDFEKLIKGIEDVIAKVEDVITSLLFVVDKIYPGLSFNPYKWVEDIRKDPSLLDIPGYAKDLEEIGTIIENNLDKIDLQEAKINNLRKSIKANQDLARNIKDRIRYQNNLVNAAEKVKKQFLADEYTKKLRKLSKEIFASFKKAGSRNETDDPTTDKEKFEKESAKIELKDIFNSTTGISDLNNPRVLRFQKLLNSNILTTDQHRLLVLTKDNAAKYGLADLIFEGKGVTNKTNNENDNDIVLVVVKVTDNGTFFIDENGKEVVPTADNVVYTSMRMARITWEDGQINVVDKEEDLKDLALIEKAKDYIEAHKKFRQNLIDYVLDGSEVKLEITGVSRGFENTPNKVAQVASEAAGIPSNVDLNTKQVVQIPANPDNKSKTGTVRYQGTNSNVRMPKGRPIFSWKNMFFFLSNRMFTSKDISNYQQVFKYLYDNLSNPVERQKAIAFLEKTLYFRDPKEVSNITDKAQTSPIGRAQFWFEQTPDGKVILRLRDKAIPFNMEDGYLPPYLAIEAFLKGPENTGVFHNVDAKDLVGKEFVEFYLVGTELKQRIWGSYQAYLIAGTYPDGTERPINEIPLTTTLLPSTDTTPNITGRYLTYKNPQIDTVISQAKKSAPTQTTPTPPTGGAGLRGTTQQPPVTQTQGAAAGLRGAGQGVTTNITLDAVGPASDAVPGRQYTIIRKALDPSNPDDLADEYTITFEKVNGKYVKILATGAAATIADFNSAVEKILQKTQNRNITVLQIDKGATPPKTTGVKLANLQPITQEPPATTQTPPTLPTKQTGGVKLSALQNIANNAQKPSDPNTPTKNFRLATQQQVYNRENIKEVRKWWERRFPQIPFRVVEGLVDGIAYGAISNHMLTLSRIAEEGTVYHEAFEAVAAYFLTGKELADLRNEFRQREGTFTEYATGKTVKYSEATNDQIREQIAEEYREYELSDGTKFIQPTPQKVSLFRQIYNFIHDFLFGRPETIKGVFDNIRNAKYKDRIPYGIQSQKSAYRLAMNIENPVLFREVMNGISNLLFQNLRGTNVNVLDFLASSRTYISNQYTVVKADIDDFYGGESVRQLMSLYSTEADFLEDTKDPEKAQEILRIIAVSTNKAFLRNFAIKYGEYVPAIRDYDIEFGPQEFKNLYNIFTNYVEIDSNWDEYVQAHKDYLALYKIEFEEGDLETDDDINLGEDKSQSEYAKDGQKFSVKQNSNAEIKMFIATLLKRVYTDEYLNNKKPLGISPGVNDVRPFINTMVMSELVDYNKLMSRILDRLSVATSFDDMVAIMRKEAANDPIYTSILEGLKADADIENLSLDEANYIINMQSKFFVSMSNMSPDPITLVLNEDGTTSQLNTSDSISTRVIKDKWLSKLKTGGLTKVQGTTTVFNKDKVKTKELTKERDVLGFFKELGFDFDIPFSRMDDDEVSQVVKAATELFKQINSDNAEALLYENKLTKESLTNLAVIYLKYTDVYQETQRPNIEGQPVQNVIQQNFVGVITKLFNAAKTLGDLINKVPQFNKNAQNAYIESSLVLNPNTLFFNSEGERTKKIDILIIEGTTQRERNTGVATTDLATPDYVAQEFAHNLLGNYYMLVTADSKTEWGIRFGHFVSMLRSKDPEYVNEIMRNHLIAEIKAAQLSPESNLVNVKKTGMRLRQFEEVLKSADPDFELIITPGDNAEQLVATYKSKIDEAFNAYFDNRAKKTFQFMKDNNLIVEYTGVSGEASSLRGTKPTEKKYSIIKAPSEFIGKGLTEAQIMDLIRFREINYTLAMIEQFKIMWGDPAQWVDITKRIKSYLSNRNTSINGMESFNKYWNAAHNVIKYIDDAGEVKSTVLQPGDVGYIFYDDTLRVQSFKDVYQISDQAEAMFSRLLDANAEDLFGVKFEELNKDEKQIILDSYKKKGKVVNPYTINNEADGQAWSFPQGYREIRERATTWTEAENEQYEWDMALMRWEVTNGKDYQTKKPLGIQRNLYPEGERGEILKKIDLDRIKAGNPYLNRAKEGDPLPVQQVLKPIYSGFKDGEVLEQDIRKMSIANLNWRVVKGTAMESIYLAHVTAPQPTHFINMESANKIGLVTDIEDIYKDGSPNTVVNQEKLHFKYFGIQVETKGQKDSSSLGTQLTKLATLNLMVGGVPLDFIKSNKGKSSRQIKALWRAKTEAQKTSESEHYDLVRTNTRLLSAMKLKAKEKLFKDFGFEEAVVNGIPVIRFSNLTRFEELIQRELKNRQAPANIRKAAVLEEVDGQLKFSVKLDLQIGSEKLESLITSMLDKRLLHPKMYGGQLPQIASTLLEEKLKSRELVYKNASGKYVPVTDLESLSKEEKESVRITSNDLKWYTPEEPWIEVKVPFFMKEFIELGQELKISDIPEDLRFAIGFRIPTQELNSVEHIKIVGFLPAEYGNSIVVPSEITTKAGSDFDIDKLNLYLYNYNIIKGKPVKIQYLTAENSTPEERYAVAKKQALRPYTKAIKRAIDRIKVKTSAIKDLEDDLTTFEELARNPEMESYNALVSSLFGVGIRSMEDAMAADATLIDMKFEVEDMELTLDELREDLDKATQQFEEDYPYDVFKTLPIELQNTKEAIDNAYIDNLRKILSLEDNFSQLISPNSVVLLTSQVGPINKLWKRKERGKSFGASLDSLENAFIRLSFLVGKAGVGIGAAAQTLHSLSQFLGTEFSEKASTGGFYFPTNSYLSEDGENIIYNMGERLTTDKKPISSIISAFINGFVDIAKDPWILDINGTKDTAGIYITAFKLGMPVAEVTRWFNQPIIRDYIEMKQRAKSVSAKITGTDYDTNEIIMKLGNKYGFPTTGYSIPNFERSGNFTVEELDSYIEYWVEANENLEPGEKLELSANFKEGQANLLSQFRKLESISWDLFRLGQALNLDTSRTVTFDSMRLKIADVVKGLNGPFRDSIIKALNETFVGTIFIGQKQLLEGLRSEYLTENPKSRAILNPILNSVFLGRGKKDVKETIAQEMRKSFLTYLFHTIPVSFNGELPVPLNGAIERLFFSQGSVPNQVLDAKRTIEEYELEENFLLNNILGTIPILTSNPKQLKVLRRMTDTIDSDHATSDWLNLEKDQLTHSLATDLIRYTLLQNGLKPGINSISGLIPNEKFEVIAKQVEQFFDRSTIDQLIAGFEDSYYRNNWWNRDLIPEYVPKNEVEYNQIGEMYVKGEYVPVKNTKGIPSFVFKWAEPQDGISDFKPSKIAKSKYFFMSKLKMEGPPGMEEAKYNRTQIENMIKKGDYSFLEQILYKRVEIEHNGKTDIPLYLKQSGKYTNHYVAFYPVARYGKRGELIEHYPTPSLSMINPSYTTTGNMTSQDMHNILLADGRGTTRFLSQVIGMNEENEDILLSLSPDLYERLEGEALVASAVNVTMFESAKTAENIGKTTENAPSGKPSIDRTKLNCE